MNWDLFDIFLWFQIKVFERIHQKADAEGKKQLLLCLLDRFLFINIYCVIRFFIIFKVKKCPFFGLVVNKGNKITDKS